MNLLRQLINSLKQGYRKGCILVYFCYKKNKFTLSFLRLLAKEGCISGFIFLSYLRKNFVCIKLKYSKKDLPAIFLIKNLANIKNPIYLSVKELYRRKFQLLLTTRLGVLTKQAAIARKIGGSCLCKLH